MFKFPIIITIFAFVSGCGYEADRSSELSDSSLVMLAPLKANQIDESADPGCLRGIEVRFQTTGDGTLAAVNLDNFVTGACEILMPKDSRSFHLKKLADDCGSKVYGSKMEDGREVLVFDHSARVCEDFRPNLIEIREIDSGSRNRLYGGNWQ